MVIHYVCLRSTNLFLVIPLSFPLLGVVTNSENTDICTSPADFNAIHRPGASDLATKYWEHFKANAGSVITHERHSRRITDLRDANKHFKRNEVVHKHISESFPTLDRLLYIYPGVFPVTPEESAKRIPIVRICVTSQERITLECVEAYPILLT